MTNDIWHTQLQELSTCPYDVHLNCIAQMRSACTHACMHDYMSAHKQLICLEQGNYWISIDRLNYTIASCMRMPVSAGQGILQQNKHEINN